MEVAAEKSSNSLKEGWQSPKTSSALNTILDKATASVRLCGYDLHPTYSRMDLVKFVKGSLQKIGRDMVCRRPIKYCLIDKYNQMKYAATYFHYNCTISTIGFIIKSPVVHDKYPLNKQSER